MSECPRCKDKFSQWVWTCRRCGKKNLLDTRQCDCGLEAEAFFNCPNCKIELMFDRTTNSFVLTKEDLTSLIERLELFEERLGVQLQGLSASLEITPLLAYSVRVSGELHSTKGPNLESDITLDIVAYDVSGRVMNRGMHFFHKKDFFGFETFQESIISLPKRPARIRVIPRLPK